MEVVEFNVKGKKYLVFGVANKKSVAYFIAQSLISLGAEVILVVLNDEVKQKAEKLFPGVSVYTCDLEKENDIKELRQNIISDNNNKIMMENQRHLFDGKSKNRILKVFESL